MSRFRRPPSLFWTFAGAFFLVLLAAAVLQAVIIVGVVRPISMRGITSGAEVMLLEAERRLSGLEGTDGEISRVLFEVHAEAPRHDRVIVLVFEDSGGRRIQGFPGPPPLSEPPPVQDDSLAAGEPRGRGRGRAWSGGPGRRRLHDFDRLERIARKTVVTGGGRRGDLLAMIPPHRLPFLPSGVRPHVLLFLPIAVLIAGGAGALLFRLLTRRIRSLEALAGRVAEGDFSARVGDDGVDEIGRLARGLNRMTERLAQAQEKLSAGDRQRRQLLADISHELATPLTSIRGYAETMLNPEVGVSEEERRRYLADMLAESKRMDLLIGDLLELSRLESDAVELDRERLDWAELCRNTVKRFEARYREAGLGLEWVDADAAWILADGRRMEQVIENLLVNALRHVPRGGSVRVTMGRAGYPDGYELVITDDGPGVPPEHLPHLFDRFYQVDPSRAAGGSGLGLAIVKEIVLRHGGSVQARSGDGRGLSLVIELPAA